MYKVISFLIIFIGTSFLFLYEQGWIGNYDNVIEEVSLKDVIERIEHSKSTLIIISNTTCSPCNELFPKLQRVLKSEDEKAYYINTDLLDESEFEYFNVSFLDLPVLLYYEEGELIFNITGNMDVKTLSQYISFTE